jgi:hypothetical protein
MDDDEERRYKRNSSIIIITLCATLLGLAFWAGDANGAPSVEPARKCKNMQAGMEKWIEKSLRLGGFRKAGMRHVIAVRLAGRIMIEAARFKLDPIVMATIAYIESGYRPWARGKYGGVGRRSNEVGIWQLIPGDGPIRAANRTILGCKPSKYVWAWKHRIWRHKYKGKACKYPFIAALRGGIGRFSRSEMKGFEIGTWLAAFEMRQHVDNCRKRNPHKHRWPTPSWLQKWTRKNTDVDRTELERYLHYNWGSKQLPGHLYRRRLFRGYTRVRDGICSST